MTIDITARRAEPAAAERAPDSGSDRFRLSRAGVLNVWQYDVQEFDFADGRLLLRGANGAGKSKTLEMLLPFALDGDKARITASAKHHTSLLWLMTDGYEGQARVGYVWVEFLRSRPDGSQEAFTCGVGIRASASARTAGAWHFATGRRVGHDLELEDGAGPLSRPRLETTLGTDGQVFERAAAYKEHVGRALFGLDVAQYDQVLRLLYWLRQPQVGEDIEPGRLTEQLSQALPQVEEQAVRSAGDTFDELTAFGEQIERRAAAASALESLAAAFATYARSVAAERGRALAEALRDERRLSSQVRRHEADVEQAERALDGAIDARRAAKAGLDADEARLRALEAHPATRDQQRLVDLEDALRRDQDAVAQGQARLERSGRRQQEGETRLAGQATRLTAEAAEHVEGLRGIARRERELVATSYVVSVASEDVTFLDPHQASRLADTFDGGLDGLAAVQVAVRGRLAAVTTVRGAVRDLADARLRQAEADRRAEEAEVRWEASREQGLEAHQAALDEESALRVALEEWSAVPAAPAIGLPDELSPDSLASLPDLAREAARPGFERLRAREQQAVTRRDNADAEIVRLSDERARVAAQPQPAPPEPSLGRTSRQDGRSLWQLVDFAEELSAAQQAGLEAALQSAGLLDGWVRPGGRLLDDEQRDVVLSAQEAPGPAAGEVYTRTLVDVLRPDTPDDCDVTGGDVRRVLAAIRLRDASGEHGDDSPVSVGLDGTWRLGPAHGRATKDRAQYVGATARAAERQRRLAELDRAVEGARRERDDAAVEVVAARREAEQLDRWQRALPSSGALRSAWTLREARREVEDRDDAMNREAQRRASQARAATAEVVADLERLATTHGLPTDTDALEAIEHRLRELLDDVAAAVRATPGLTRQLGQWVADHEQVTRDAQALASEQQEQRATALRAEQTGAALASLRDSVGDSVRELAEKVTAVRTSRDRHRSQESEAEQAQLQLTAQQATARADLAAARERLAEQLTRRGALLEAVAALAGPPGLLTAATDDAEVHESVVAIASTDADRPLPATLAKAVVALGALTDDDTGAARISVFKAHSEASTGPAADHQPAVASYPGSDLLAVIGQDDGGEAPVVDLARRVRTSVDHDRTLLTENEKKQFEQHVLGELGDAIRRSRRDAQELVVAMNTLLGEVTTSQGIRVRLDWKLRDDVPAEARAAVDLLAQPVGALIPEEREQLRDVLHRLIEASRAERPELSYADHLAAALDYRTWSGFTIRYSRPEKANHWDRLHRRSPLSQGEQKVLCYLPLFAAAAAHFTSLAGAAPHAPRLVLLDDAFPKIDVRTHPLLFGLLVQLDLDFVMTSERLWGDHATVPSLAIYEALRDPNRRGIAQYEYRWDGRVLEGLG